MADSPQSRVPEETTDLYIVSASFNVDSPALWTFIFSRMMTGHCKILNHQRVYGVQSNLLLRVEEWARAF